MINAETRRLVAKLSDHLLHTTGTASAVNNQQEYELPNKLKKLRAVTFTIGSDVQYVKRSPSREHWDSLNTSTPTAITASFPEWYYPIARRIRYWPTPASTAAVITYDYDIRYIDSTIADYVTGTIVTLTQGSTTVDGGSTTWSTAMVGRYMQIAKSNTFASDGDGDFYEIGRFFTTTQVGLVKTYAGHSVTSGAATYLIGEVSPLPDGFHELPIYRACEFYYSKNDKVRQAYFKGLADNLESELFNANDPSDHVVVEDSDRISENPNNYPRSLTG